VVLRGALNRGVNVAVGAAVILRCCLDLYRAYAHGVLGGREPLFDCFVFLLGVAAGLPAYLMNRRALSELYDELNGKIFLSSQLALLDSHHGKNALAYFYLVAYAGISFGGIIHSSFLMAASGFFVFGGYLSAHVVPFVFPPKR